MKILLIHTKYQNVGGEDIAVKSEATFLKQYYELEEIYFSNHISKNLFSLIKYFFYFLRNKNRDSLNVIEEKIQSFQPDVIYIQNTWFKVSLGVFKIAKQYQAKVVLKLHNYRHFCTNSFLSKVHLKGLDACYACGFKKKKFRIFNKYFENSYIKSFFVIIYGKAYSKILINNDIKIITLTNFQKKFLINQNINEEKIFVFPNYLDKNTTLDKNFKLDIKSGGIVYAGRITKEKGLIDLIEGFISANLKEIPLHIIGDGPLLDFLKLEYDGKNIFFHGELDHKKVIQIISKSKAVITATRLYEGQPTLLCEASQLGVPSVFPDTGGVLEFFPENYPLSYKKFDQADLINKLKLISNDDLLNQLSLLVKENIEAKLSDSMLLEKFSNILKL